MRPDTRPLERYAAIGDGRSAALVADDGAIDWWCPVRFDAPSVFAAVLDAEAGGGCTVEGAEPIAQRYAAETNVATADVRLASGGAVRLTDALVAEPPAGSAQALVRRIDALEDAEVVLRIRARPGYGGAPESVRSDGGGVVIRGTDGLVLRVCGGDAVAVDGEEVVLRATLARGRMTTLALLAGERGRIPEPAADDALAAALGDTWARDAARARAMGGKAPAQRDAVVRSAQVLELLTARATGAIVAAPTASLPEWPGGSRNWDYRFMWLRDAALATDALLRLGRDAEARRTLDFLAEAGRGSADGRLQPLYRLDGDAEVAEHELPLSGWRGSTPVRVGNAAHDQRQLGSYGDLLQTAWLVAARGHPLGTRTAARLARIVDALCDGWHEPDSGIWELRGEPQHHTHSKVMCWVAFDRAVRLADAGRLPAAGRDRWAAERDRVRAFVETECWSQRAGAFTMHPGTTELDAAVTLSLCLGILPADDPRLEATCRAVVRELGEGELVYRMSSTRGEEGTFLACAFWLADALHRAGARDEASERVAALVARGGTLGLLPEEIGADGTFLGNYPQGLSHLSLINAVLTTAGARDAGGLHPGAADPGPVTAA